MVVSTAGRYVSKSQMLAWLRKALCKPHKHSSTMVCDYWITASNIVFSVARPEATAGGKTVVSNGSLETAYDLDFALDLLNHVYRLYELPAQFEAGDVFAGEPVVKLNKKPKH